MWVLITLRVVDNLFTVSRCLYLDASWESGDPSWPWALKVWTSFSHFINHCNKIKRCSTLGGKMQSSKNVWQRRKHFFSVPWNCFPRGQFEQRQTSWKQFTWMSKERPIHSPCSVYSEQTRIYFWNSFTSFSERLQRESFHGAAVQQNTSEQARNMESAGHFVATAFSPSSSPFIPFRLLHCAIYMTTVPLASLNWVATM